MIKLSWAVLVWFAGPWVEVSGFFLILRAFILVEVRPFTASQWAWGEVLKVMTKAEMLKAKGERLAIYFGNFNLYAYLYFLIIFVDLYSQLLHHYESFQPLLVALDTAVSKTLEAACHQN